MPGFLEKIAAHIHAAYPDHLSELCIVLPNRRAKLFLRTELAKHLQKPIWMPDILSIEEFVQKLAGKQMLTSTGLLFRFYEVYRETEKEKAAPFDEFSSWAPTLLHDFNEVDNYLVDAESLFTYLNETRAIDVWNPGGSAPTEFQVQYLEFFRSLGTYYKALTHNLLEQGLAYPGLAYRVAAAGIQNKLKELHWHRIIFAGFNALNTAEEQIIETLVKAGKAEPLWDADLYYTRNRDQEAGKFLRRFIEEKKLFKDKLLWEENTLSTQAKKIEIIGVPQNVGQAKLAGHLLESIHPGDLTGTALVLADENLLSPVLNSIPANVDSVNVTMGYSLKNVPLFNLLESVFGLYEYMKSGKEGEKLFYHRSLVKFIRHPYIASLLGSDQNGLSLSRSVARDISGNNRVYVSAGYLGTFFQEETAAYQKVSGVFSGPGNSPGLLKSIRGLLQELEGNFKADPKKNILELEYCYQYTLVVQQMETLLDAYRLQPEIKTLHALFANAIRSQALSFYGEPLKGLQLMGMLETRTLDFETVILLSANEDILPSGKKDNSFIPYEIKRNFGLPTYSDKDAVFAYHFYRLVQRAKNVYLLYNTETDELGSGEKSRFLTQLIQELPLKNKEAVISEKVFSIPLPPVYEESISIEKKEQVMERLAEVAGEGFSPSRLNTYRNCGLQFYFQHIERLRETEEVEESVDAATFGNVVHQVLEELYRPSVNVPLTPGIISAMFPKIEEQTRLAFQKHYKSGNISSGRNLLSHSIIKKIIRDFLEQEKKSLEELSSQNQLVTILELEEELVTNVDIAGKTVHLKGKADRIDRVGTLLRIIDYKTGQVDARELKLETPGDMQDNPLLNKSFQLLMYAYLYQRQHPNTGAGISPGIVSFRAVRSGLKKLSISGNNGEVGKQVLDDFELYLKNLLAEILDPGIPFTQTSDHGICSYCAYKDLCGR